MKRWKKRGIGLLSAGIITLSLGNQFIENQEEQDRIELEAQKAEEERLAQEELARLEQEKKEREEAERLEADNKLKLEIIEAIEKVEAEPKKSHYNRAMTLLNKLHTPDDRLLDRLENTKSLVDLYEEEVQLAREALKEAEENLSRESYNEAFRLAVALSIPNKDFDERLSVLDVEITKVEEEKIAAEKAEAERVAAEAAAQQAQAAQSAPQQSTSSSNQRSAAPAASPPAQQASQQTQVAQQPKQAAPVERAPDPVERTVFIAPHSGTKYHFSANCRGLRNANSIKEVTLTEAQNQGYDLCGWEK